jgi:hypothetical protein
VDPASGVPDGSVTRPEIREQRPPSLTEPGSPHEYLRVSRESWGALVGLVVVSVAVGATVGCFPNPDDLRRSGSTTGSGGKTGSAGSTISSGGAGSGTGRAGTTGGSSGPGAAGATTAGTAGTGGSGGPGTAGVSGAGTAGGSGTGTAGSSGAGILEATYTKWATAICTREQACIPSLFTYYWGDATTCITRNKLWIKTYLAGYADITATDTSLSGCATQISAQSCLDWNNGKPLPMCALPGKRANGAKCDAGDQCASLRCSGNATACGTCAARVALNGACVPGDCADGLICGSLGTCVTPKVMGASCAADTTSCAGSLRCRGGICSAPLTTVGAACVDAEDCDTGHGVLCDSNAATPKCIAWSSSPTICAYSTTLTACSKGGFCEDDGTCTPAAADGRACDDDLGPTCLYPAVCSASNFLCTVSPVVRCTGATTKALTLEGVAPPEPAAFTGPSLERGAAPLLGRRLPRLNQAAGWRWSAPR